MTRPKIDPAYCNFKLSIGKSRIHRWGLFAAEPIPKNRKVIEYTGERCNRIETRRRGEEREHVYMFTLNSYWAIDGAVGGSGAEYINHCCEPNLVTRIMKEHILYFSLRDIAAGEELFIDYRFGWDVEHVPCKCGALTCRGLINIKR